MRSWTLEANDSEGVAVSVPDLASIGIQYVHITDEQFEPVLDTFAKEHGYQNKDQLTISPTTMPNFEEMQVKFFQEHIHEDDEVRFVVNGVGHFDVRSAKDQWIRIEVSAGDLLVLPAGIYHRFSLPGSNAITVVRLFKDLPKWTPINRPLADEHAARLQYEHAARLQYEHAARLQYEHAARLQFKLAFA